MYSRGPYQSITFHVYGGKHFPLSYNFIVFQKMEALCFVQNVELPLFEKKRETYDYVKPSCMILLVRRC